jgi:hypothetical protein
MNALDEMNELFKAISNSTIKKEIEQGVSFRDEGTALLEQMFKENSDREKIKEQYKNLLTRMKDFEKNIINFEILNFLYADIARTALNSYEFKVAIQYAQAGIEINQKTNDIVGVKANRVVILDAACFMGANKEAIKIFDEYPNIADPEIKNIIKDKPSINDNIFRSMLLSKARPKSLSTCLDAKLSSDEKAIRTLMQYMGISRKTALEYKKTSDDLPPGFFGQK